MNLASPDRPTLVRLAVKIYHGLKLPLLPVAFRWEEGHHVRPASVIGRMTGSEVNIFR